MARRSSGIRKVAKEDELERETRAGWRIAEVLREEELVQAQGCAPRVLQPPSGYGFSDTVPTYTYIPVTRHKYLLALDEESSVAKLNEELTKCKNELNDAKASEHNALVARTRSEAELVSIRCELEKEKQDSVYWQKQYSEQRDQRDRNRKLEVYWQKQYSEQRDQRERKLENDIAALLSG